MTTQNFAALSLSSIIKVSVAALTSALTACSAPTDFSESSKSAILNSSSSDSVPSVIEAEDSSGPTEIVSLKSCTRTDSVASGKIGCMAVWEYGNEIESDAYTCHRSGHVIAPHGASLDPNTVSSDIERTFDYEGQSCEVRTPACASQRAKVVAARSVQGANAGVFQLATEADLQEVAAKSEISLDLLKRVAVRYWMYQCL